MSAAPRTDDSPAAAPSRRGFLAGAWASVPVWLAIVPFGVIFGTLAREAGLSFGETMAFTAIVVAGASQLAALQVLGDGAPAALAVLTGAVVNLRMAMYSAALAAHWREVSMLWRVPGAWFLHDQAFALSMRRYRARPDEPLADKLGFYFGVGLVTTLIWTAATAAGATLGRAIPPSWGLDFAVPATFLAVAAPMIRGRANIAAAASAVAAALAFAPLGLPAGLGLLAASLIGIGAGVAVARRDRLSHEADARGTSREGAQDATREGAR
ncbi:MAG: AzlC family ABC transporter permease [Paracoccaceae bacterium]